MSPALKEAIPVGTLAGRVLKPKPLPAPAQNQLSSVSQGWRSAGFQSVAEKLSAASSRLKSDAERESEYWQQIADLTTRGWAVSRLPRDRKAIGVHFGFPEAAPRFRDRGFTLLRQSDDGTVILDWKSVPTRRKHLSVYVVRKGVKTGFFHFQTPTRSQKADINQQLTDGRDALFEEELFYEICRESHVVANQGVTTRAETVEADVGGDYQLSFVFSDEPEKDVSTTPEDNMVAEFVAICLRLLLNAAHEQNLIRRSQKPPPMTVKPRPIPEYALIRPVLTHLRHRAVSAAFWESCQALLHTFHQAGLPVKIALEKSSKHVFESLKMEAPNTILSEMMIPAITGFEISLPLGRSLEVGIATLLGPPLFGSRYETSAVEFEFSSLPVSRHETREAASAFVRRILTLDLVAHIEALAMQSQSALDVSEGRSKQWKVSQPHTGELTVHDSEGPLRRMQVSVQPESISVKLSEPRKVASSRKVIFSWTAKGCSKADGTEVVAQDNLTFEEVVVRAMEGNL